MSEANNVWRVEIDGREREIELEHTMLDKRTISVDGEVIEQSRKWSFGANEFEWDLDGHPAKIKIDAQFGGLAYGSSLHVDGRHVEPLIR
jgi:hypothetical protein